MLERPVWQPPPLPPRPRPPQVASACNPHHTAPSYFLLPKRTHTHTLARQHPEYVDKYIAGTSDMFRAYIRDGLAKLEARDDGAQDPGTPPASAANGAPADGRPGGDDRPPLPVPPRRGAGVAALTRPSPGPAGLPPVLSIPSPGAAPGFGSGTPGGQGAAATPSPLASARSDGSAAGSVARLNSLRYEAARRGCGAGSRRETVSEEDSGGDATWVGLWRHGRLILGLAEGGSHLSEPLA